MRIVRSRLVSAVLLLATLVRAMATGPVEFFTTRLEQSEFNFVQSESNAPFLSVSWIGVQYYSDSRLSSSIGELHFKESSLSQALALPVWIGHRDMLITGEFASWQSVDFSSPFKATRNLTTVVPLLAWLRQTSVKNKIGAFVAPQFTRGRDVGGFELNNNSLYFGGVGLYDTSAQLSWAYGVVGFSQAGDHWVLPYAGCLWRPRPDISISFILPWPSASYAPTKDFMLQFGLAPAGADLATTRDGAKLRVGYDSINLMLSAHYRVSKLLWLSAGAGASGFGSFSVNEEGGQWATHLTRGMVWSLRLSLRPYELTAPAPRPE